MEKSLKLYVVYKDYGYDGCTEPEAVFTSPEETLEYFGKEKASELRYKIFDVRTTMGAFLNSLYEEGTPTEIAYWVGYRTKELELEKGILTHQEHPSYSVITNGNKRQLLEELAKVTPY